MTPDPQTGGAWILSCTPEPFEFRLEMLRKLTRLRRWILAVTALVSWSDISARTEPDSEPDSRESAEAKLERRLASWYKIGDMGMSGWIYIDAGDRDARELASWLDLERHRAHKVRQARI